MLLTKEDLIALRKCDKVLIGQDIKQNNSKPFIRCFKEIKDKTGIFSTSLAVPDLVRDVTVDSNLSINDYTCFTHTDDLEFHDSEMRTVISLLKENDEIILYWRYGNNNQYLDNAGLYKDELLLKVKRNDKHKYCFFITVSVCQDNSGRMIRKNN